MADKKKTTVAPAAPASDKKKALETAMAQIERAYGKGSIMRLGDAKARLRPFELYTITGNDVLLYDDRADKLYRVDF